MNIYFYYDPSVTLTASVYDGSTTTSATVTETAIAGRYVVAVTGSGELSVFEDGERILHEQFAAASTVTIPPDGNPDTVSAYITCRDAEGVAIPNATFYYQLVKPASGGAWDDEIQTATADGSGVVTVTMVQGHYEYWINDGRHKTVKIDADTPDPYALPQVTG